MKLTNYHREAFVNAAMDDVPQVDYDAQAAKILQDFQLKHMPKEIRAIYENPELRGFLKDHSRRFNYSYISVYGDADLDKATYAKIEELETAVEAQSKKHRDLRRMLESVAARVTTRKALVEALPEFEKYMPAEDAPATRCVPALANIVSSFVAAGWPKDRPKPAPAKKAPARRKAAAK